MRTARLQSAGLVLAVLMAVVGFSRTADAASRRYVLNADSSIASVCPSCRTAPAGPEALSGSFEVTVLPATSAFDVAAVTDIQLSSASFSITGNGFLQRLGPDRQSMVIDGTLNDAKVVFTSGRRQYAQAGTIDIILSSTRSIDRTYVIVIHASPVDNDIPDADNDGVADGRDNCAEVANADQADADGDHVGDACDACGETAGISDLITPTGCSIADLCPCDASRSGATWGSQTEYLRCVAKGIRGFRRTGQISRTETLQILRRAAASGCGRTVLALR